MSMLAPIIWSALIGKCCSILRSVRMEEGLMYWMRRSKSAHMMLTGAFSTMEETALLMSQPFLLAPAALVLSLREASGTFFTPLALIALLAMVIPPTFSVESSVASRRQHVIERYEVLQVEQDDQAL